MMEDKKYVWWGILGIGVAAFFYFLSKKDGGSQAIQVPYLVPQQVPSDVNGMAQTGGSITEQPNIIGNHPNNPVPNATSPSSIPPFIPNTGTIPYSQWFQQTHPGTDTTGLMFPQVQVPANWSGPSDTRVVP